MIPSVSAASSRWPVFTNLLPWIMAGPLHKARSDSIMPLTQTEAETEAQAEANALLDLDYPSSDGKRAAETEIHLDVLMDLITSLRDHFRLEDAIYISCNLLMFYEEGNKLRHLSPDVFLVKGIPRRNRDNYLMWREGKGPDFVIELTSKTTAANDLAKKFILYQDVLKVTEYVLFDPKGEYLNPQLRAFRRIDGVYQPIEPDAEGRFPSLTLGLNLEASGTDLRLHDPSTDAWIPTRAEQAELAEGRQRMAEAARRREETSKRRAETAQIQAETAQRQAETARRDAEERADREESARREAELRASAVESELLRLRREIEALRGKPPKS